MISLFKKIDIVVFFVSLCIGLFMCYITNPTPEIIIKYPNPDNNDIITYIDEASNCYKYEIEKLDCPVDQTQINDLPIN